jgi:hypothetical protein
MVVSRCLLRLNRLLIRVLGFDNRRDHHEFTSSKMGRREEAYKWVSAVHSGSFSALRVNGGRKAATILSLR